MFGTDAKPDLILASASASRAALLTGAGVSFTIEPAYIDEAAIKADFSANSARNDDDKGDALADHLSQEKARTVSARHKDAFVIGADQILSCAGRLFDKPANLTEAHANLIFLRGRDHTLHSSVSVARQGDIIWRHTAHATLTMRAFSDRFLDQYLTQIGDRVLSSVGCYQLEGPGVQLFKKIDGDYFTILGLPLLPLLAFLRAETMLIS